MPRFILRFLLIIFLKTTFYNILLKVLSSSLSFKIWYPFNLIIFLGFFNLLISRLIVAKLVLKSRVIIIVFLVYIILIWGCPVTKISELLSVGILRVIILVIIWLLSSRVRLNEGRLFILRTVVVGLVIITFS